MLKIGSLLNEAKTFVEHGEWLPWLQRHTAAVRTCSISATRQSGFGDIRAGLRQVQRCPHEQAAAAWVDAKNATVAYLDLDYLSPALPPGSGISAKPM
jgi:hypothetical protein